MGGTIAAKGFGGALRIWTITCMGVAIAVAAIAPGAAALPGPSSVGQSYSFKSIARILGPSDIGVPPGENTGTADASAIALPDGRTRVYFALVDGTGGPGKIASAISTDGIHFTVEEGLREPADRAPLEGFGEPLIVRLPGGGYRLFYNGCHPAGCGISSATSFDGLTFSADSGLRLSPFTSFGQPVCSAIAKLADGRYRMYCSQQGPPIVQGGTQLMGERSIYSAVSSDLLDWTVEAGRRIGPGAPFLAREGDHPSVIAEPGGGVTLVYDRRSLDGYPESKAHISYDKVATSQNGLTFRTESDTGLYGHETSFVRRTPDTGFLYYGDHTPADGSTIGVARVTALCVVPNVAGKTLLAARRAISDAGCETGNVVRAYSNSVRSGLVISQRPDPGTKVAKGGNVNLVVSKGKHP